MLVEIDDGGRLLTKNLYDKFMGRMVRQTN